MTTSTDTNDTQPTLERAIKNVQFCQKRGGCPSCRANRQES